MVKSVYNTANVNAGKFAGSEPLLVVNAGTFSHSGGTGAVPEIDFEEKIATLLATLYLQGIQW